MDSDFFAIRKITHMSAEILSRIVENFIDGVKRSGKVLIRSQRVRIRKTDLDGFYAR